MLYQKRGPIFLTTLFTLLVRLQKHLVLIWLLYVRLEKLKVRLRASASPLPGSLLEMQNLRFHFRPAESEKSVLK